MMKEILYDVAVIGAGPAGSTFACELATRKPAARILLINGQNQQNAKPCGGLLSPDAQKVLAEFELTLPNTVLADPQIFSVHTIDLTAGITRLYQRHYLNMDRLAFDRWLLSRVACHVQVINGRCTAIERNGNFELTVHTENGMQRITARTLVGADGASSIVRRQFFTRQPYKYVSIQQWFAGSDPCIPAYACIFDKETSDSCSWLIRKDDYTIFGGAFAKSGSREAFEAQKARLEQHLGISFGQPLKTEACQVCSPRSARDFVTGKDGVYLIGEAAGLISASSFEGISSAMLSGRMLAKAFEKDTHAGIAGAYRRASGRLRFKLFTKTIKRKILCSPALRYLIMKSGVQSVKIYRREQS